MDIAPPLLLSSTAPRVRPPPSGPREDCANEKFRDRYAKSEVFRDRGKRHFEGQAGCIMWSQSAPDAYSPPCGGAASPRAGSVTRDTSDRYSPRGSPCRSPRAAPAPSTDLFSAPPGTWTPMLRNSSRAGSPSGCMSPPSSTTHDHAHANELVAEASRRLRQTSPPASRRQSSLPDTGRKSTATPGTPFGMSHSYLPPPVKIYPDLGPQAPPMAPSQMISSTMASLLKPSVAEPGASEKSDAHGLNSTKALNLTRTGWTRRRRSKDGNSSPNAAMLIQNDEIGSGLDAQRGSDLGISPRGRRHVHQQAAKTSRAPWLPEACEGGGLDSNSNKLAAVARTCMQQKELQIESEQRLGLRPQVGAQSPRKLSNSAAFPCGVGTSLGGGAGGASTPSTAIHSGSSGKSEVSRRGTGYSTPQKCSSSKYHEDGRTELPRECTANRVQCPLKQSDSCRASWHEPAKQKCWR